MIGFWIPLHCHILLLLLLMTPLGLASYTGRGNCSHLEGLSLKYICHGYVPDYIYSLYRDYRAPADTPYSVWQTEAPTSYEDMIVLISFHENYMHSYDTLQVMNVDPEDTYRTMSMETKRGSKSITIHPSLLYCFPMGLRYPMELRSNCLGHGRSSDVASRPVLHYAMHDLGSGRGPSDIASTLNLSGILLILTVVVVGL
ncbi:hypothetical protein KR032_003252 [Drosophila birchii]|nr:hypothetical protein KR032_003252 [Drosophila birchii]